MSDIFNNESVCNFKLAEPDPASCISFTYGLRNVKLNKNIKGKGWSIITGRGATKGGGGGQNKF